MKIRLAVVLVGLAISFVVPAFAQDKDTVDPQIKQQIRVLAAKYDAAFNNHDATAIAALYTEDGFHVFHGKSHGRKAIEKSYTYDFQSRNPNNHISTVHQVIVLGNEVRTRGKWSATQNDYGPIVNHEGYFSWTVVPEGDAWKIRKDTTSEAFGNSLAYLLYGG
jgi:uncharacterized protein (TIGR02246 family)